MSPQLRARFDVNNQVARANRASFDAAGITVLSLVGPAGSGKTSLIEALLGRLDSNIRTGAIVAGLAAERQVERITRHRCRSVPLVTDDLAAVNVRDMLDQLKPNELDLLLIESEGNARSPVEFDLGQHRRACVFSAAGGDDKATEYPFLIAGSDVVILSKIDLLPLVKFDRTVFNQDVARVKPKMPIIQVSVQSNQGVAQWADWVTAQLPPRVRDGQSPRVLDPFIRLSNP